MAMPTIVGVGAASASTGAITPALPSGVQENDILVLFVETAAGEDVTVSGYDAVPGSPVNTATGSATRLSIFWKRAGSSESDPTTSDSGDHQIGAIMAVRGCVTKGNPFLVGTGGTTGSGTTKTGTALRTYIDDVIVINAFSQGTDGRTTPGFSNWTNASLANLTERLDAFTDEGNGGGFAVATGEKATAGSVSATTATDWSSNTASHWSGALIPSDYDNKPLVRSRGTPSGFLVGASVALPLSWQEGDLLLAFVETNNQSVTISGYTAAGSSPASNAGTNPTRLSVFYKWATSSESAPTTSDSGDHNIAQMIAVRGGRGSGDPFDVTNSDAGGTSASISIVGATTTRNDSLVLVAASTTLDPASTAEDATFTDWTNADLTGLVEVLDYANTVGTGGGFGVATGYKTTAGAYTTTSVTQTSSVEYATWTGALTGALSLSANAGTLSLTGAEADFGFVPAESGDLTLAGGDAGLNKGYTVTADPASYTLTGQNALYIEGSTLAADAGTLSFSSAASTFDYRINNPAKAMTLEGEEGDILAGSPETFSLPFLVDLIPPRQTGSYQRYTERLTVDGNEIPVRSWSFEETPQTLAGTLQIELADVTDRSAITKTADIEFEVGEWISGDWRWTKLLDTGKLESTNYAISASGIGPADTFTFTGLSEMDDRLNKVAADTTVFYDPARFEFAASDFEDVRQANGVTDQAVLVPLANMTLYSLMTEVLVARCGFVSVGTNIPNFAIGTVRVDAGRTFIEAISGLIGMFNPSFSAVYNGGLRLFVADGTESVIHGLAAPRQLTTSASFSLGIADDVQRTGALVFSVNQPRYTGSFGKTQERTETSTVEEGRFGNYKQDWVEVETTTTYRDFYTQSNDDSPTRSELVKQSKTYTQYPGGRVINESEEKFSYDREGNLIKRRKQEWARIPAEDADENGEFPKSLRLVAEEYETITWAAVRHRADNMYRRSREVVREALVCIDTENQQLGEDYKREALDVYRAGNMVEGMERDWMKVSSFTERSVPERNGTVKIETLAIDYLQGTFIANETDEEVKTGEPGKNIYTSEQRLFYVLPEGSSVIDGPVESVNMGELPLPVAVSLATRMLRNKRVASQRAQFGIVGIDPIIQKGMPVSMIGRNGEDLGNWIVEARRLEGSAGGYQMTLQARSARTS